MKKSFRASRANNRMSVFEFQIRGQRRDDSDETRITCTERRGHRLRVGSKRNILVCHP